MFLLHNGGMQKSSKEKDLVSPEGTIQRLRSQPFGPEIIPTGFTSGDVFFNPEASPAPFTNPQFRDPAPQGPHPILNRNIDKEPAPSKTTPKLVPPPPPVIPEQAKLSFPTPKPPSAPSNLVPPLSPMTFPATPPPIESPSPAEVEPNPSEDPYQYPESEGEGDSEPWCDGEPQEEMPEETTVPPAEPAGPATTPQGTETGEPVQSPNPIISEFKRAKGIVELPLTFVGADFCGSLCVPVEEGHSVVLLLLVKHGTTGPGEILVTNDGLYLKGKDEGKSPSLTAEIAALTGAAVGLQGDIAKDGTTTEQIASFLSGSNLKILAPRAKVEAVRGPGGTIIGYFQAESLVQFVVTVALVAEGPVTHYLDLPFPAILGSGVETYLLPNSVDVGDFVRYLAAKNAVGWQGQKTRAVRHRIMDKQTTLGRTLTWGGSAVIAYAFAAGLLGAFFPDLALSLSLLAPALLGAVLAGTAQLWRKAKRDMLAINLALAHRTSWRLVNFARDQVDRTTVQLQGAYKRQFLGEMRPEEVLDTITKLGQLSAPDLASDPQMHEEVTAVVSYMLGPRAGADKDQLTDALAHAIAEVKRKRVGGAAKVVMAVARARVQAIVVKVGKVPPKDMTVTMALDDVFSMSITRAKFSLPTSISVPLLALERDVTLGNPIAQDRMKKAIAAATLLVETTGHFWAGKSPDLVKEIPYPKASAPAVGEDFDNAFG